MAEDGKTRIERFDGQDFGWWKMQIEDLLYQKDLYQTLSGVRPEKIKEDEWAILDRKAVGVIRLSLAKSVGYNVVKETTACGLMKALSNMYEKPSASNKVFLIRQLVNNKMKEGASAVSHINDFNTIISRLLSVDIKFDDEVQALLLLSSLPESWSGTVTAVSSSSGSAKLSFEGIRDLILGEDIRRRSSGESSSSTLLSAEGRGRKSERGNNRGRSKSRKRGQSKPRKDITCWNCQETGHFRSQCPKPQAAKERKEVNAATAATEAVSLICCVENSAESWIMDSGASFHATCSTTMMKNLRTGNFGKVRLANNHTLDITGMGDIDLKTSLGTSWTLKDVRVIPSLRKRLISIGQLDDLGYDVLFGGGKWKVIKGNLVIAKGVKRGTLYMVEEPASGVNAVTSGPSPSKLWHQRLGHMSEQGLKLMARRGKFPDLKKVESETGVCEPCVLAKQKRVTFLKLGKPPKAQKLALIHTDVCGPTPVSSLGGSSYYVTFIDDSTRKVDMTKVKMDVMRPWIAHRVTELLGFEDEVLINFIYGLLEEKVVNGKEIQISLTGFMEKNTGKFMKELWTHLLSAQQNASGVPQQFLDAKEEETRKKQEDTDRITRELKRTKEKEGREHEQERVKMDRDAVDVKAANLEGHSRRRTKFSSKWSADDDKGTDERNGSKEASRIPRSPHSADHSVSPPRGTRSRSISKSFSKSRSHSRSRSLSASPKPLRHSVSLERRSRSLSRRSSTPRRVGSRVRSPFHAPSRGQSPSPARRRLRSPSPPPSRGRSPSPARRRLRSPSPAPSHGRSTSPARRRLRSPGHHRSRSPVWRRSRSPVRQRSPSPLRRRSRSPTRRRSRTPIRRRSRSPIRRRSRSPIRRRSRTPIRRRSRTPIRRRSRTPIRRRPRTPIRRRSRTPIRRRSRSPIRRSRSPIRRRSPFPYQHRPRSPYRHWSQSTASSSPVHSRSPSPVRGRSPSPMRRRYQKASSPRHRSLSPIRGRTTYPSRQRSPSPGSRSSSPSGRISVPPTRGSPPSILKRGSPKRQQRSPVRSYRDGPRDRQAPRRAIAESRSPVPVRSLERDSKGRRISHNGVSALSPSLQKSPSSSVSPPAAGRSPIDESPLPPKRQREGMIIKNRLDNVEVEEKTFSRMREDTHENKDPVSDKHDKNKHSPQVQKRNSRNDGRVNHPELSSDRAWDSEKGYKADEMNPEAVKLPKEAKHNQTVSLDSGSEESDHKRKHKRKKATSDDDISHDSHTEDRKEAKRRRKEEKKLKKEEKRKRREERRRKKDIRRSEKLKVKAHGDVSPSSDFDKSRDESALSDEKKLEIELREKALESLRAKKGVGR